MDPAQQKCLFEKINIYLINSMIDYASSNQFKFKLNLFKYSKLFQKKLDIDLNDYKYNYFDRFGIIFSYSRLNSFEEVINNKKILYEEVENFLKKIKNISIDELIDIYKKYFEKNKAKQKKADLDTINNKEINSDEYYDIYSPFSEILLNYYDYPLKIHLHLIKKYNLLEDYISFLKNIKITNLFFELEKFEEIQILREIELDVSKLRKLKILLKKTNTNRFSSDDEEELTSINEISKDDFLSEIFSTFKTSINLESFIFSNTLYDLDLDDFNPYSLKSLNNLKNLTSLQINDIGLSKPLTIILPNLQKVSLKSCENILLDPEKSTKKIKYIELYDYYSENNVIYKFDNLEKLILGNSIINIDYISLKKLKSLELNLSKENIDFFINILKYLQIEEFVIKNTCLSLEDEIKIFELIIHNKTLIKIELSFYKISNKELKKYENDICNNQINTIIFSSEVINFEYKYFLKKFPNIKKIGICNVINYDLENSSYSSEDHSNFIKLKNDENIIIEDINIHQGYQGKTQILSFSFSKIKILFMTGYFNKESFSLFNDTCNDKFDSLEDLTIYGIKDKIIFDNIINNIKNCKNLKNLSMPINYSFKKQFDKKTLSKLSDKFFSMKINTFF